MVASLSAVEEQVLDALTLRVRLLSVAQVARTWWPDSRHRNAHARRVLRNLEREGLIRRTTLCAHPELSLTTPVSTWSPGLRPPEASQLSRSLQRRWCDPPLLVDVALATQAAANFFGGVARTDPKRVEQTHDLHLSTVFLVHRSRDPLLVSHWISEGRIHRSRPDAPGEKLPDAMIQLPNGARRVIEFGGAYRPPKLQAFHAFCEARALPYEIW